MVTVALLNVRFRLDAFAISALPFLSPVTVVLTLPPLRHHPATDAAETFQASENRTHVSVITSKKVSGLSGVEFKATSFVYLCSAFEKRAPNPHHTLDWLLYAHGHPDEFFVTHHSCVMAEPPAQAAIPCSVC